MRRPEKPKQGQQGLQGLQGRQIRLSLQSLLSLQSFVSCFQASPSSRETPFLPEWVGGDLWVGDTLRQVFDH